MSVSSSDDATAPSRRSSVWWNWNNSNNSPAPPGNLRALGQRAELLEQIEVGKLHPAMVAFGLWRDEHELGNLAEQIYANRKNQGARAEVKS